MYATVKRRQFYTKCVISEQFIRIRSGYSDSFSHVYSAVFGGAGSTKIRIFVAIYSLLLHFDKDRVGLSTIFFYSSYGKQATIFVSGGFFFERTGLRSIEWLKWFNKILL